MNGRKIVWHLFASTVVIFGVGSSVRAADIYASSIIGSADGYHTVSNIGSNDPPPYFAYSNSFESNASGVINYVYMSIWAINSQSPLTTSSDQQKADYAGKISAVSIFEDSGGLPTGNLIGKYSYTGVTEQETPITVEWDAEFKLVAGSGVGGSVTNQKYWVVLETIIPNNPNNDLVEWNFINSQNSIAGTNANILLEEVFKKKSGSPWKNGTREESYKGPLMFTISTTPAPEPSTYVLGAVMTGVLAFVHRYQARQKTVVKSAA
jgi:hypothetical protein